MRSPTKLSPPLRSMKGKEEDLFRTLINYASDNDYSVAIWRLPDSHETNLIISISPTSSNELDSLEELPEGFIFAPYEKRKDSYFLKADLSFSFAEGSLAEATSPLQTTSHQKLPDIVTNFDHKKFKPSYKESSSANLASGGKESFEVFVTECINQIETGTLEKVVPSRIKIISLSDSFDVIDAFQRLCIAYPNAMISLISIPKIGTWIGASPELLVSVDQNVFKTVALAGTKMVEQGVNLKNVSWTQKEIEEQALVSRYIINNFKKIRLREFEEHGPKTVLAGNLVHLKTEFTVDMKATNFPQLGSVMLNLLHPTSAVCGMPLEAALVFLQRHEGYDREFYSGYLGPVNFGNTIHIFVNLRCMQLLEKRAIMYAGAGVTSDSVPESEWEETEMKLNTLLKIIL